MKPSGEPDLELRGKLVRSLGLFREMLPGSFVERQRACGRPTCHCADGKRLHVQYQISLLVDGQPKTLNVPAQCLEREREKIEIRRRFEAAAATIFSVNLKRVLKENLSQHQDRPILSYTGRVACSALMGPGGWWWAAIDGIETWSTCARWCAAWMEREVQHKVNGEMQTDIQYYHRIVVVVLVSTEFPIPLGVRF